MKLLDLETVEGIWRDCTSSSERIQAVVSQKYFVQIIAFEHSVKARVQKKNLAGETVVVDGLVNKDSFVLHVYELPDHIVIEECDRKEEKFLYAMEFDSLIAAYTMLAGLGAHRESDFTHPYPSQKPA